MGCTNSIPVETNIIENKTDIQTELKLVDINIIPKFTFNNFETYCKVVDVYDGNKCTVIIAN